MSKVISEHGVYEQNKKVSSKSRAYILWSGVLRRCYCPESLIKYPSYLGCSVSDNFKNFQFFAEWCTSQVGWEENGWQLDKDILVRGNKIYSENTCCFVPREINTLNINPKVKGKFLLGVSFDLTKDKYIAKFGAGGTKKIVAECDTELQAYFAYKECKEEYVRKTALVFKDKLDPKVYEILSKYELEIGI